jgi:cellulase
MIRTIPYLAFLLGLVTAQTPGHSPEVHPKLQTWKCTNRHGCVKQNTAVVLDALTHSISQKQNPSLGCGGMNNMPNTTVCPDASTCAENCIIEGISDYESHGVTTKGSSLTLLQSKGSPRVYLLEESGKKYEMLHLTGNELAFDVDVSKLPCGMNGALYLAEMDKTGGQSKLNGAGAKYGTGYCDAQCFTTTFINGVVSSPLSASTRWPAKTC